MKIILCLVLIAIGLYGLVREHERRTKVKSEIMKRVIANHLIAKDALSRLSASGGMGVEDFSEALGHLTDNSIEIILKSCGSNYVEEGYWLIKEYEKMIDYGITSR